MPAPLITTVLVAPDLYDVVNFQSQAQQYVIDQISVAEEMNAMAEYFNNNNDMDVTEYGFSVSAISDASPQDVKYTLSVGRNLGTAYSPSVRVKGIGQNDDEEYFDEALATESYVNSVLVSDSEPVSTISTSTFNLDSADIAKHIRCTFNGAKTMTIRPESTHPQPDDARYKITNRSNGLLSIALGSGVTVNRNYLLSTSLVVQRDETILLKRVAANNYDIEYVGGGNFGLGAGAVSDGTSTDYTNSRGCGFYTAPVNYDTTLFGLIPSNSPFLLMDQSANGATQWLDAIPSNVGGEDDGRIYHRQRTGAVWRDWKEIQTTGSIADPKMPPLYNQSTTVSGITLNVKIWKGKNPSCRDALLVATVSGTASSTVSANTLPNVNTPYSLAPAENTGSVDNDFLTMPLYTGAFGVQKVLAGNIDFNKDGEIYLCVVNGSVFSDNFQVQLRYKTAN